MIKFALSGANGKMGRVISGLVKDRTDCEVGWGIDLNNSANPDFPIYTNIFDIEEKPDVIIDYSHPSALPDILTFCKMRGTPLVVATTGYSDEEIAQIRAASEQIPIFFTFNMSLGINLLVDLARRATKILGSQFDVEIVEKHHNLKKDAPSGTAIMLAEAINSEMGGGQKYIYDRHNVRKAREQEEIGIHAIRGGTIVGEHDIIFAGHDEVITLSHSALSKEVFAVGSINAAIYLSSCDKGLYDMSDLLKSVK